MGDERNRSYSKQYSDDGDRNKQLFPKEVGEQIVENKNRTSVNRKEDGSGEFAECRQKHSQNDEIVGADTRSGQELARFGAVTRNQNNRGSDQRCG